MRAFSLLLAGGLSVATIGKAAQAPCAAADPDLPISSRDRIYAAEQFSNTVSVTDPSTNRLLGVIRLGEPQPTNFSPLYRGQVLVHGMGFAPDGRTIAVVSIGSNGVSFIDTATNAVRHTTYVGRSPHEAFFTPDGREVWVTVRGEDYIAVIDTTTYAEVGRVKTPNGPGMTVFSPDGRYAYVCSSFTPALVVFAVATRTEVGRVAQPSPFCPNIAATPDGKQVWYTLKDVGKTVVIDAAPPFATLAELDTGPITNHVNFVDAAEGRFAYVTVGGLNEVQVFDRRRFSRVATIHVGSLPHGIWPSGDGSRVYVGLEGGDQLVAIDTRTNSVISTIPIGQGPQAINYVPGAVPDGDGQAGLQPLELAGNALHMTLGPPQDTTAPTSIALYDQGLVQILEASVTGLPPHTDYVLGFRDDSDAFEPLASFTTNPAGAAIVNATGQIRQIVTVGGVGKRWLEIVTGGSEKRGATVQVQRR